MAAITLVGVLVLWASMPAGVGQSACRVGRYYQALEDSGVKTGIVERLVFSVILTKAEKAASVRNATSFS